jgi:putative addiction module component (TIGR02574 family)
MSINEIIDEALTLKPQERYKIIETIYESLSASNLEIEQAWIEESHRRIEAIEKGEMETIPYEEVFSSVL